MSKTKASLALMAAYVIFVGVGVYLRPTAPEPIIPPDPGPAVTLPAAPDEPLEPTRPHDRPPTFPVHWPGCASRHGTLMEAEDAWLKVVLASRAPGPLFGLEEWAMEAAECGAYRERMAWWPGR